jgi:23S rRNA pseudouridine1911/1915/1917 synthase
LTGSSCEFASTRERKTVPPEPRTFVATALQSGLTVLAAIRQWLPGTSWSAARTLLADRHVAINGSLCLDEARRIKAGETVTLYGSQLQEPPSTGDVRLVWLDQDVIVVDKPAGMTTLRHAAERNWRERRKRRQPTLDDLLPEIVARHEGVHAPRRQELPRIYSVHRIDRGTSGLVVFARNSKSQQILIGQFEEHTIERVYLAVARGDVAPGTIESFLVEDRGDGKRGSATGEGIGKRAVTHLRPREKLNGFTLIECRLETGRTHQIRIHLSEAGHPLYGDPKYGASAGGPGDPQLANALPGSGVIDAEMPRLALHAAILGFHHPIDGKRLRFESPLPRDFWLLIDRLRRATGRRS